MVAQTLAGARSWQAAAKERRGRTAALGRVKKYLDDLKGRYGGVDALLLWPTFPQLGMDDRNQFDMFRTLPGGVPGLRALIGQLHARGVKVLLA